MRNKSKKIMSVLLALCVTLCSGSALAFADEADSSESASMEYAEQEDVMVGEYEFFFLESGNDHIGEIIDDLYLAKSKLKEAAENLNRAVNLSGCGVTKNNVGELYQHFISDNPQYFYLTSSCQYTFNPSTNEVLSLYPKYITADSDNLMDEAKNEEEIKEQNDIILEMKDAFEINTQQLMSCITPEMSSVDKLLALHDALACHTSYKTQSIGAYPSSIYSAYGAIVERGGVCQSYALAYQYLATLAGIQDICVVSNQLHGWNMVYLDEQWYHIDVTYDDPNPNINGRVNHKYFLISDAKLKEYDASPNHATWSPSYSASDTRYEDEQISWKKTTSQIIYGNGNVFYNEMSSGSSSKPTGTIKMISIENPELITDLAVIDGVWYAENGGYYTENYTRLFLDGDYVYYNTSKSIMRVSINDKTTETIYTLPDDISGSNNIYGLAKGGNAIIVNYAASPSSEQSVLEFEYTFDTEEPAPEYALGDADKNGVVDINDVTYIQKYIASLISDIDLAVADLDGSGSISIDDVTQLQKHIANID